LVARTRSPKRIRRVLRRADARLRECATRAALFPGESITLRVEIEPSGRVASVMAEGAHYTTGARCYEQVVASLRFGAAREPQTVSHRYRYPGPPEG